MAISVRPGWKPRSRRFWLVAGAIAAGAVLVAAAISAGLGSGIFDRGQFPAAVGVSPSPSPSGGPTPSPTASPNPTPPASVLASLTCRIAISNGSTGSGGWISLPGGAFSYDAGSRVSVPFNTGSYAFGLTQDLALNRWLPVRREWVTPDGMNYVYPDWSYGSSLRVIDRNGNSRLLAGYQPGYWNILSAEAEGVYVDTSPGLLLVGWDGALHRITGDGYWQAVGGGSAYAANGASLPTGAANTLIRRDLRTGATADFFTVPGLISRVAGFGAGGAPVIEASDSRTFEIWVAGNPPTRLLSWPQPVANAMGHIIAIHSVLGDRYGTWIATNEALYLYTPTAGLEQASTVTGQLASNCR
jgi:hypothetical protein